MKLIRIFETIFGKFWYFILLFILLIILSPLLFLHNVVEFSPEKFNEEWIKMIISCLVFYIIIRIIEINIYNRENLHIKERIKINLNYLKKHFEGKAMLSEDELKFYFDSIVFIKNVYQVRIIESASMMNMFLSKEYSCFDSFSKNTSSIVEGDKSKILGAIIIMIKKIDCHEEI